jgi:hypothetical protein
MEGAGSQVVVVGKQIGVGRVRVNHLSALNSGFEILVIVEKDTTASGVYISTESALLEIKPNDTRQISVRLIGGNPEDIYGFIWNIEKSTPIDTGREVLRLVPSADTAFITGLNEGDAIIRVRHPKTSYVLDITVVVRLFSAIKFTQRSLAINVGQAVHVPMECPTGVSLYYGSTNYYDPATGQSRKIVNVSGTKDVCIVEGIAEGVCIVGAYSMNGAYSDEIIVEVKKTSQPVRYIQTPDVIYNMTDWQSANNSLIIKGKTIGQKNNGSMFTELDDKLIMWEVVKGKDIIGLGFNSVSGPKVLVETKEEIKVYPIKAGTAEIRATHKDMPDYQKSIHMYVTAYNANFQISPMYLNMQIKEEQSITAFITNLKDIDYSKVEWSVSKNEKGEDGIKIVSVDGVDIVNTDGNGVDIQRINGRKVRVQALAEGVCNITATFNNITKVDCSVYVEKRKILDINRSYFSLLPGQVDYVLIKVEPDTFNYDNYIDNKGLVRTDKEGNILDAKGNVVVFGEDDENRNVFIQLDTEQFLDGYPVLMPYRDNSDPANMYNRKLVFKGIDRDGYTQITLTANYIEKVITTHSNFNYLFRMRDILMVRGKPGDRVEVPYDIYPQKDNVWLYTQVPAGNVAKMVGGINTEKQIITYDLVNCGFVTFIYKSKYNEVVHKVPDMEIPVYVYYPKVDLSWVMENRQAVNGYNKNISFHSRIDDANNAIYIADGEQFYINYARGSSVNAYGYLSAFGFPGSDVEIKSPSIDNTNKVDATVSSQANGIYVFTKNSVFREGFRDQCVSTEYIGMLTIEYRYSDGRNLSDDSDAKGKGTYTKKFMVYLEQWARIKP